MCKLAVEDFTSQIFGRVGPCLVHDNAPSIRESAFSLDGRLAFESITLRNVSRLQYVFSFDAGLHPQISSTGATIAVIDRSYFKLCDNLYVYHLHDRTINHVALQHMEYENIQTYWLSFNGDVLISRIRENEQGDGRNFRVWDTLSGRKLGEYVFAEFALDTAEQTQILYQSSPQDDLKLWDLRTGEHLNVNPDQRLPMERITSLDGERYATLESDMQTVNVWQTATRTRLATFEHDTGIYSVRSLRFSLNGNTLLTRDTSQVWRVWDISTQSLQATVEAIDDWRYVFSPNFTYVAVSKPHVTLNAMMPIDILETGTKEVISHIDDYDGGYEFTPDETVFIITRSLYGNSAVDAQSFYEVQTGKLLLSSGYYWAAASAISPDGRFFIRNFEGNQNGYDRVGGTTWVYAVPAQQ
jgi:WD40 repeat protein